MGVVRAGRQESAVWRALKPREAAGVLVEVHEGQAGEEALFMALLAEQDMDTARARFWVEVYGLVIEGREAS